MAVNVSKYKATSKILVGKLTPFFVSGNKVLRFLSAICHPLDTVNTAFLSWAKDTLIDAATTSQVIVMEWSMNQKLGKYFANDDDSFHINTWGRSDYTTVYEDQVEQEKYAGAKDIYMPEQLSDTSVSDAGKEEVVIRNREEITEEGTDIVITAPKHNSSISDDDYTKKIRQCFEPYLAYDMDYTIHINKN